MVILTNTHALDFPTNQSERKAYVKSTSEKGKLFSVNTLEDVVAFLNNTLLPDLGIRQ
jgi:hypothetical protein